MKSQLSKSQKTFLIFIMILLVILSGIGIGYGLYKNRIYNKMISDINKEEKKYYITNNETGIKIELNKECDKCSLSVKLIDNIRKGIINTYEIKLLDENGNEKNIDDLDVAIMVPIDNDLKGYSDYKMLFVSGDEILKTYSTYTDSDYIVFKTSQLGIYGITGTINVD